MTYRTLRLPMLLALVSSLLVACGGPGGSQDMPPQDVSVAKVVDREVSDWDEYTGRIQAVESVEIRPRVAGYLDAVHFQEGGDVKRGALLFTIDDREYQAATVAAKADVARAQSRLALADEEYARSQALIEARAVSKGELDTRRGEQTQAQADLLAAKARLQQAELNLGFTRITSPITGRIGAALIKPGNLVAPGESLLSTVVSIDPVHVVFEGDERAYLRYQQMDRSGERGSSRDTANPVEVALADEATFQHKGHMDFVDNAINPATGTIRGRAVLDNPDGVFTPGLFARVRLLGANPRRALLIHDQAIMTDQDRKYVWVVDAKGLAARKDIEPGESVDGLRIIERGLDATDRVVVNGVRKIFFPGQPLKPREVPMDDPAQAAPQTAPPAAAAPSEKVEG